MDWSTISPAAHEEYKANRFPGESHEWNYPWHSSHQNVCVGEIICQNGRSNTKVIDEFIWRSLKFRYNFGHFSLFLTQKRSRCNPFDCIHSGYNQLIRNDIKIIDFLESHLVCVFWKCDHGTQSLHRFIIFQYSKFIDGLLLARCSDTYVRFRFCFSFEYDSLVIVNIFHF